MDSLGNYGFLGGCGGFLLDCCRDWVGCSWWGSGLVCGVLGGFRGVDVC